MQWPLTYNLLTCIREAPSVWCLLSWALSFLSCLLLLAGLYVWLSAMKSAASLHRIVRQNSSEDSMTGSESDSTKRELASVHHLPAQIKAALMVLLAVTAVISIKSIPSRSVASLDAIHVTRI